MDDVLLSNGSNTKMPKNILLNCSRNTDPLGNYAVTMNNPDCSEMTGNTDALALLKEMNQKMGIVLGIRGMVSQLLHGSGISCTNVEAVKKSIQKVYTVVAIENACNLNDLVKSGALVLETLEERSSVTCRVL